MSKKEDYSVPPLPAPRKRDLICIEEKTFSTITTFQQAATRYNDLSRDLANGIDTQAQLEERIQQLLEYLGTSYVSIHRYGLGEEIADQLLYEILFWRKQLTKEKSLPLSNTFQPVKQGINVAYFSGLRLLDPKTGERKSTVFLPDQNAGIPGEESALSNDIRQKTMELASLYPPRLTPEFLEKVHVLKQELLFPDPTSQ
ncbi:hypothetical protein HGA88_04315 [Candidatus Roizmanbacteria bacterium]|nr:hypothetical protein [Candidatus Roizmanbacteria bacterium]